LERRRLDEDTSPCQFGLAFWQAPVASVMRFAPAGRRAEQEFRALCGEDAKDRLENGGLSTPGPPVITMTLDASATLALKE
jgi:hypothetical protein